MPFWKSAPAPERPTAPSDADALAPILDAFGAWLAAYTAGAFDTPGHGATDARDELDAWHRHATRGTARPGHDDGTTSVGVAARDWAGIVRAFRTHRRTEHDYVVTTIAELRDALWGVVETVHRTATLEQAGDAETGTQLERARGAIARLAPGQVKDEVLDAVARITEAARARQHATRQQYVALARSLDTLGAQLEEARRESTTDALTELGNRKLFDTVLPRVHQLATLGGHACTLVMLDADGLKTVNDTLGHPAGDAALVAIAKCLARTFLRQGDALCRIGGDEFAVILQHTDAATADRLAQRFVTALESWPHEDARLTPIFGASCGVAQLTPGDDVDTWVRRADAALYAAKRDALRRVRVAAG